MKRHNVCLICHDLGKRWTCGNRKSVKFGVLQHPLMRHLSYSELYREGNCEVCVHRQATLLPASIHRQTNCHKSPFRLMQPGLISLHELTRSLLFMIQGVCMWEGGGHESLLLCQCLQYTHTTVTWAIS